MATNKDAKLPLWVSKTSGYQKLVVSLLLAAIAYPFLYLSEIDSSLRFIICWDIFAVAMITMSWLLFFYTNAQQQRQIVIKQDEDIRVIFTIVVSSVCISLAGAILLLINTKESPFDNDLRTIVTILAVTTSWILLHTIFTIRYAHLYHNNQTEKKADEGGGLDFPNPELPDYIDFAYFSFVIGMTFQVSDVTISSKTIRRYALLHSLISFVFNTIIVALTVNIIAGIIK